MANRIGAASLFMSLSYDTRRRGEAFARLADCLASMLSSEIIHRCFRQRLMTTILLIRHAVNDFVKTGKLAGWTAGVHLNDEGLAQAEALGQRLAQLPLARIYASPIERTLETAAAIVQHHPKLDVETDSAIGEVRYGDWEGKSISELARRKMWGVVQEYPSRARFPNGETCGRCKRASSTHWRTWRKSTPTR